jgi:hypothetical protein
VERHGGDLVAPAGQDQHHGHQQAERVAAAAAQQGGADAVEPQRAGQAVEQRQAVEHDRAADRAEDHVLQRGLGAAQAGAHVSGHHVAGQAHRLHGQVEHQQVARLGHHHHGHRHQDGQQVELALVLAPVAHDLFGSPREQHRGQPGEQEEQAEEHRHSVDHDQVAHDGAPASRHGHVRVGDGQHAGHDQAQQRDGERHRGPPAARQQVSQNPDHEREAEHDFRQPPLQVSPARDLHVQEFHSGKLLGRGRLSRPPP